jgi:hypothetical protein
MVLILIDKRLCVGYIYRQPKQARIAKDSFPVIRRANAGTQPTPVPVACRDERGVQRSNARLVSSPSYEGRCKQRSCSAASCCGQHRRPELRAARARRALLIHNL